ncbi:MULTISPECIES: TetR/AcrR family transcriptional regulator [unclassified Motilimonas]|uniref:TetR/AcrR family transcriptional regulator n=1 Tax=unclassified Motilimonas TaxID=2643697 RepID=UPI001E37F090|nr:MULTISPECIES: TetR/AcrR family transcriptional regulator [unclassified Motilimonas]MCE0558483.1 TetR/AcrR family transcriptional regulator [Motilimonas sp. E26]MDO6526732.1 TetR/AcrR family transcriptional regulator [Motilimonas sp. 1_MG-2023]
MRNAEFDREKVLRCAMTAFMDKGYGKTSMQDLKAATGLHPGSIYCAFENKRGLLLAALEQYRLDRSIEFAAFFADERPALMQLKAYIDDLVQQCLSCDSSQACLLTKALNEMAEQDAEVQQIIANNLAAWQQALTQVFERAKSQGELTSGRDCEHLARYLAMGIYGLRTFAHTHPNAETLQALADQLYHDICA